MPIKNRVSNQDAEELLGLYQTLKLFENTPVLKMYKKDLRWILQMQSRRKWSNHKFNEVNELLEAKGLIKIICRGVVVVLKEQLDD